MAPKAATQVMEREDVAHDFVPDQAQGAGELVVFQPARLPYHPAVQDRFNVDKGQWKVLTDAIFPAAKTVDSIVLALSYCQHRKLDIMKKVVHIVPMWDSKRGEYVETVWPGIAELRTTAARTKQYAGCDEAVFGPTVTRKFTGEVWVDRKKREVEIEVTHPEWCRITVFRIVNGVVCKFVGPKVVWLESYATQGKSDLPNTMWQERPEGQIEKCAEAAALRRAFPEELGNEYSAEEMEGRRLEAVPPGKEVSAVPRDDAPPRRVDAEAAIAAKTETAAAATPAAKDEVTDAEYVEVTGGTAHDADGVVKEEQQADDASGSMDDEPTEPEWKGAYTIDSKGMSYAAFEKAYCDAVKQSRSTADVMGFIDKNRKNLDKLFTGYKEGHERCRRVADEMLKKLRQQNDPISTGTQPIQRDDGPPRRAAANKAPAPKAKSAVPADPEETLKAIGKLLDAVKDPNDLNDVWMEKCIPLYDTLDFPGDKEAANALYRKSEQRLGID
jgi:phage recombination protein Bet